MSTKTELKNLIAAQQRTMGRTIPMIFGTPAKLQPLFGKSLRAPASTHEGMSVVYLVGNTMKIVMTPTADTLEVVDATNFIPPMTVSMNEGELDVFDQLMLMGASTRISLGHKTGVDPVKDSLYLGNAG